MSQDSRARLRQQQAAKAKQHRVNRILGIGVGLTAAVLVAVFAVVVIQSQSSAEAGTLPPNATPDGKAIVVNPGKATPGAPVVELFFDYQCPVCNYFEQVFGSALEKLANDGEIELHYRTMTFLDENLGNDSSTKAGVAAACADVSAVYPAFHNEIFANQPEKEGTGYTDQLLRDTIPATVGLTGEKLTAFQACYDTEATGPFLKRSNELGQKDLIATGQKVSTPSLFVNGHDIPWDPTLRTAKAGDLPELIKQHA